MKVIWIKRETLYGTYGLSYLPMAYSSVLKKHFHLNTIISLLFCRRMCTINWIRGLTVQQNYFKKFYYFPDQTIHCIGLCKNEPISSTEWNWTWTSSLDKTERNTKWMLCWKKKTSISLNFKTYGFMFTYLFFLLLLS